MSTSIRINIDQPCHENWQNMPPHEQGRFCGSCRKAVVDFSTMTDKEILDHIATSGNHICAKVTIDQLNRDIKVTEKKKRYTVAYIWNLFLATFLLTKADAQICPAKKPLTTQVPHDMKLGKIALPIDEVVPAVVKGTVIDSNDGKPIPGAYIMIKGANRGSATDSLGNFQLSLKNDKPVELVVSSVGFETKTILVDKKTNSQQLTIVLPQNAALMGKVVVIGYPRTSCRGLRGRFVSNKVPIPEKIKKTVHDRLPKKEIKTFPNPAIRGNNVQVSLVVQQTGTYKLELMDAAGKLMMVQAVQMPDKTQNISIPTNEAWSAGVYWVRVSGQHVKHVYQTKVLLK